MKFLFLTILIFLFVGCSGNSPEYNAFVTKHGATSHYYCNDAGFLVREHMERAWTEASSELVLNEADVPTRCNVKNTSIQVKETVSTGSLSGSVN